MIRLVPCPKARTGAGGTVDKALLPEETLARFRHAVEAAGALGFHLTEGAQRIDIGRLDIPVYISKVGADAADVMSARKQMGKGATIEQAEVSALMELAERYAFFTFMRDLPGATYASWREAQALFGDALIPVREILQACGDTALLPDQAERVLNTRKWAFVPATAIHTGKTVYIPVELFRRLGEFNGSSAGNTDVESIFQGACELIERHVCCLMERKRTTGEPIAVIASEMSGLPGSVPVAESSVKAAVTDSPPHTVSSASDTLAELQVKFRRAGIEYALLDFSSDLPVPSVGVVAFDPATFPESSEIVYTAGTASSPEAAAVRALTEAAQLGGDFCTASCYEPSGLPKLGDRQEAAALQQGPTVSLADLPSLAHDDILQELLALAEALHTKGYSLYSVATADPLTRIPSHFNIIPGFLFRERDANACLGLFAGRVLAEEEDEDTAAAGLKVLAEAYPNAHFLPFFHGLLSLRAGRLSQATDFFRAAEPAQPNDADKALAAFYLGYAYSLTDADSGWESALPAFSRAVALCPEMKEYRNRYGVCLYKLGRFSEAAKEFAFVVDRLDKGSAVDRQNLGLCLKALGKREEAREQLLTALSLDPTLQAAEQHLSELFRYGT